MLSLAVFSAFLALGCGHTDPDCDPEFEECNSAFQQVGVTVQGLGAGSGTVVAEDISTVRINCVLPSNSWGPRPQPLVPRDLHTHFSDAGGEVVPPRRRGRCRQRLHQLDRLQPGVRASLHPDLVQAPTSGSWSPRGSSTPRRSTNAINIYNGSGLTASFVVNGQTLPNVAPMQSPSRPDPHDDWHDRRRERHCRRRAPDDDLYGDGSGVAGPRQPDRAEILNGPAPYSLTCTGF